MSSTTQLPALGGGALGTDRFVIERQLGEGSMGAVYLAYDRERHVRVALKSLRRVDASGIYRFKREFRSIADVSHPSLVQLQELFSAGTEWFFTMEYVEGEDFLSYVLGEGRSTEDLGVNRTRKLRAGEVRAPGMQVLFPTPLKSPERLRDVLAQVTDALMAVHATGKLHRDLKPDNVLVTPAGRAVVLDFGIAFELQEDHGTMEAGVMGTPAYMSPEQAAGLKVDAATDFYALGAMLYQALTGRVPFDGSYREVLRLKQSTDPPPPSELVDGVPDDLNVLCVRLLSRDPEERPTGRELLEALGRERNSAAHERISSGDATPPFAGRGAELAELERALSATDEGAPVVAFVHGLTGMGKTALVQRFLGDLRKSSSAIVLSGRCYEHEMVPFKALDSVVDSLSRYLGRLPVADAAEVMPKDVHALAQLFPVLKRVDAVRTARRRSRLSPDRRALRRQASRALRELLARIAMRQPLVVFIDDLHWGDRDSARLLGELLEGYDRPAMLLLCTYRTPDRDRSPCLSELLPALRERTETEVRELTVEELAPGEAERLAATLLGESGEAAREVARESRGSPYLVTQLVEHLRQEHPMPGEERASDTHVSLERAMVGRLEGLSDGARTVLEVVAVSGRPVPENVIAAIAAEGLELGNALQELRRTNLVRGVGAPDARAIGIYHERIRDAVLSGMDADRIQNWHRRLALALENADEADLEALTAHLLGAQDYSRAGIYAIRAASQAMETLAFDKAAELYAIAVKHHEDEAWRQELLLQWAEALVNAGRSTQAADVYVQAARNAEGDEAIDLQRRAGVQLMLSGRYRAGLTALAPALDAMGLKRPENAEDFVNAVFNRHAKRREAGYEFTPRDQSEIKPATLDRLDALWSIVQGTLSVDPLLCQTFSVEHLELALAAGEPTRLVQSLCAYFMTVDMPICVMQSQRPRALQAAENVARNLSDPRCQGWIALARAFGYETEGMLQPARLEFSQAAEIFADRCQGVAGELRAARMLYARVLVMLGQMEDLGRCAPWIREADQCEDLLSATRLRLNMVTKLLLDDDVETARRSLGIPEALASDRVDLTDLLHVLGRSAVVLYTRDATAAEAMVTDYDRLTRTALFVIPVWRSDHMVNRSRLFLLASQSSDDPELRLEEVEDRCQAIEELGLECHVDHARILRAGLCFRRDDVSGALHWLNSILSDADMGGDSRLIRACARIRKGQLLGGEEGAALVEEGKRELASHGARNPARFAELYSSGFDPIQ